VTEFWLNWLAAVPGYAAPLLLACLGLLINERAGILNLGAEGMMACGALAGAMISLAIGSAAVGILASAVAGSALAAIFAIVTIYLRANQVVTGLVMVAMGAGLTGLLGRDTVGIALNGFKPLTIPVLSELPWLGPVIFKQNMLTLIAFLLVPLVWYTLFRTVPGLRLRAVGEDPATADASGVEVLRIRFFATLISGAFCGAAGGYLSLASSYIWVDGMIGGRGWIAVGLGIFARWRPGLALIGALLFGAI